MYFLLPNGESLCPVLPRALCAASLGEGQGLLSVDSRERLSCNSGMLGNFSMFIVCLSLRHVQVGRENRKVGKKTKQLQILEYVS